MILNRVMYHIEADISLGKRLSIVFFFFFAFFLFWGEHKKCQPQFSVSFGMLIFLIVLLFYVPFPFQEILIIACY